MSVRSSRTQAEITHMRVERAQAIAHAGNLNSALAEGRIPRRIDTTLAEALVLGLLQQDVRTYFGVFGHGSTEIGEVLRIYSEAGIVRIFPVRHETEASHAAAALRWVTGEKAAVFTSIGPGALQALAGSIVPASDGLGVWYLFGDETTQDEGFNMQQIPKHEQGLFLNMTATMGRAYSLHTPLALPTALQRGLTTVDHPYRAGPFFLLCPMNTQATQISDFNLAELPQGDVPRLGAAPDGYDTAVQWIRAAKQVVVKIGGGARWCGAEIAQLLELADGVLVHTPIASGSLPASHPRNMGVGGSKGSLNGNYAMENADLLIAIGTRAVCQSDCSRTGYPNVQRVININADLDAALHYRRTLALVGDAALTLQSLNAVLTADSQVYSEMYSQQPSDWMQICSQQRQAWMDFKAQRYAVPVLEDAYWGEPVLTQPAVIKIATDWAKGLGAITFFDAGDVQANGFQIVEDEHPCQTMTESGASYMGFGVSALLASVATEKPFYGVALTGDGSFTMNPQILIDGVEHGVRGCIVLLDNGRMAAISGLQTAQYGEEFATANRIKIDYLQWARGVPGILALEGGRTPQELEAALVQAGQHAGLSFISVRVYYGPDELGGMGVFGRWNVGNWCEQTQALRHEIGL
jgi:3D-(3,5/4)-trihydroxycyclohexane-1,2-dione acylhydrolase (decyclizing)